MARDEDEKRELGIRLANARSVAGMSQPDVAKRLADAGFGQYKKAAVSAWEKGRNIPDALVLSFLANLYDTTPNALLGTAEEQDGSDYVGKLSELLRDIAAFPEELREGAISAAGAGLVRYATQIKGQQGATAATGARAGSGAAPPIPLPGHTRRTAPSTARVPKRSST